MRLTPYFLHLWYFEKHIKKICIFQNIMLKRVLAVLFILCHVVGNGKTMLGTHEVDGKQVEYTTVKAYVEAAITALAIGDYAKAVELTALAARVTALETDTHTHANKALLDTYTQTEADLTDAVGKKHDHANADELAKIEAGDKAKWDGVVEALTIGTF